VDIKLQAFGGVVCLNLVLPAFDYTGQQISNNFFVSVMNMLLIYLFSSMKLENGHKKIIWL
jgi:hypothetical protein